MNLFKYQGQEEDHYTHILASILSYNNFQVVEPFLENLLKERAINLNFKQVLIMTRKRICPQEEKPFEYIIGIAPYKNIATASKLEDNSGSIPDAWIYGENFNLLFEFKIRGALDKGQISAHKKLLSSKDSEVLEYNWNDVKDSLQKIELNDPVLFYLVQSFIEVIPSFKSKRRSSGMPKQIISQINKENELHFIITGSRVSKNYSLDKVYKGEKIQLNRALNGIQEARRFIAKYVLSNYYDLPIEFIGQETVINDYCVVPGRSMKKNQWNQWRIGAFLN
ncbi:hypothetical protein N5C46_22895 [Rossellomorea vietnamensis]|uniref:Uncharacterized protein n=1 Tax=Rossellomorea vietnamensis TaxID=218284 RepID=A0ACD4C779_9BACI|nr:hypothetical protein [Rossellomorea vietnamensis]UXH44428.1 hypothetical protein N5C46_22895 [Rossellomorea vietnamensis]